MSRVLLLEEGWSSTLYLARALEDAGHEVTVLTANGMRARVRRRSVQWESAPPIASSQFLAHVDRVVRAHAFDHVLPLTEAAMQRVWSAMPAWADRVHPRTDPWQHRLLSNKHVLLAHMASRGVDIPRQRGLDEAIATARELGFPLVVKEAIGAAGARVRIVDTQQALADAIDRARRLGGDWVVQEYVAGPTFLVGGLFHEGTALRIFAAEKLEQHPPRTGPAIRLRSVEAPALLESALRVMRELRWTGFASLDFVRRASGSYALLEVNPRLWGSVAATLSAGVELFEPFSELLAGGVPAADLSYATNRDSAIFPRYLMSRRYRNLAGVRRALGDLWGAQGREWRHPRFVLHTLRRLVGLRRLQPRF